jgi:tetratricopeptide (TPR) repeat protein
LAEPISPRVLSALIASIYDCALDPSLWEKALADIGARLDCQVSVLYLTDVRRDRFLMYRTVGIEYALGAFDKAIKDFQDAASIQPKSPAYPGWEAIALVSAGDLPKAREAIDRAFAIQSDNVIALTARARLRLVTGEIDAAEADLAQLARRGALIPTALETQQLIMIHKIMKPSDKPSKEAH